MKEEMGYKALDSYEVFRAEWQYYGTEGCYTCPICSGKIPYKKRKTYNFCPFCGVKMKRGMEKK